MRKLRLLACMVSALIVVGCLAAVPVGSTASASIVGATASSRTVDWDEYLFIDAKTTPKSIKLVGEVQSGSKPSGFEVYRKDPGKKKYKKIATVRKSSRTLKYTDKKVKTGKKYKYKFRSYSYAGGGKSYSKFSSVVSLRAVYRAGKYQVEFTTPPNTRTDSLVMKVASDKGNGTLAFTTAGTEFNSSEFGVGIGLDIAGISDDGVNWTVPTGKKVSIKAGQTKYVKFVPNADARADGVTSFLFNPADPKAYIDFWNSGYYNGFPTEFDVEFGKTSVRAYPNDEFYH